MSNFEDNIRELEDCFEHDELLEVPEFNPTPEQTEAVEKIINWYRQTKSKFYVLKGYAGTGKTYLMTYLARTGLTNVDISDLRHDINDFEQPIRSHRICFTAPTNKAVKVLRNYLNEANLAECTTKTIYSLLGLSLQANGEVKELSKPEEPVDLSRYDLIVVDEASMVNRFLMTAIEEAFSEWKVPFLFMGDPAQLPPVGETHTPVWNIENVSELTQVMRYGNSMLDLATNIRKVVDNPFPSIRIETAPPVFRLSRPEWLDAIVENLELLKSGEGKVIAWRNITVDVYNRFVRGHIFGVGAAKQNVWLPEDKIVATAHLKDLDDETFMRTDEEATILQIVQEYHPKYSEFGIWNILALDERGCKVTIRTLTPEGLFALNNQLNELSMEAKSGKRYKWREFWALKEAFHEVRHSYAITSHRSQGSSYRKVFVDFEDIMLNRNRGEAFRSLYVSCTRQREELYIS